MEKPIVLKQRFRLDWFYSVAFVLQIAFVVWEFLSESTTMWFLLPYVMIINASVFFARVKLERSAIIVQNSLTDTRKHEVIRILRYSIKPQGKKLDVELTVEQMWPPKSELFGIQFSLWRRKPASIQERVIRFSIELDQAEILMDYLRAHGAIEDVFAEAIEDVFAEMEWRKLQIMLASNREMSRLKKEQGELSAEDKRRILAEVEERLLKVEEEL